jgi:hypothetical protein
MRMTVMSASFISLATLAALIAFGACAALDANAAVAAAQTAPCAAAAHRAFDFWLGEWQVHTPDGKLAGHNSIRREYDGCVLHERYTAASAYRGESLNIYDAGRKLWHQSWVDNSGTLLLLDGGLRDGRMVLEGPGTSSEGRPIRHRITWTPNADGTVRQLWEMTDAAGHWSVAFDGLYSKVEAGKAPVRAPRAAP